MPFFANSNNECIFCEIAEGKDIKTRVLNQTQNVVVFKDIRPVAKYHLLAIPKDHHPHAKSLNQLHVRLLQELVRVGQSTLEDLVTKEEGEKKSCFLSDVRLGFHWPPFISVSHLHLHLISPSSSLSCLNNLEFHSGAWWFRSPSWLHHRISHLKPHVLKTVSISGFAEADTDSPDSISYIDPHVKKTVSGFVDNETPDSIVSDPLVRVNGEKPC